MYNDKLKFNKNGKFTILQVSDAQDMHIPRKAMFKMLNKIYDRVNPDLIVLTGDNILGNHVNDALIGNRKNVKTKEGTLKRVKKALGFLLDPIEERKIPFAFIYGNHDDKNCLTKDEQAAVYKEYNCCIPYNESDKTIDCDTYNVPVYSADGEKIKYNIWMMDSAGADDEGNNSFEYVKKEALDWYCKKSDKLEKENGSKVMSLMFQHIPVPQTKEFFIECGKEDKGAVKGPDGKFFKLDNEKASGFAFEYAETCEKDFGQLEALKKQKDVCALVFGHDHLNSFTGELNGINIIQTSGASFRSYGNMISRGVRVFTIDESDTSSFETYTLGYFDIFGKKFSSVMRYIMNADEYEYVKVIVLALASIIGIGLVVYILAIFQLFN